MFEPNLAVLSSIYQAPGAAGSQHITFVIVRQVLRLRCECALVEGPLDVLRKNSAFAGIRFKPEALLPLAILERPEVTGGRTSLGVRFANPIDEPGCCRNCRSRASDRWACLRSRGWSMSSVA